MRPTEITLAIFEKYQPAELAKSPKRWPRPRATWKPPRLKRKYRTRVFNERIKTHAAEVSDSRSATTKAANRADRLHYRNDIPESRQEIVYPHGHGANRRSARYVASGKTGNLAIPAERIACRAKTGRPGKAAERNTDEKTSRTEDRRTEPPTEITFKEIQLIAAHAATMTGELRDSACLK